MNKIKNWITDLGKILFMNVDSGGKRRQNIVG
jgi:hypothetical protein